MPKTLQYKEGSLIYFQGDAANEVFILQSGGVQLAYQNIENGEDIHETVQPGEFFGLRSALGRYPREENAITVRDSSIMTLTTPEFEILAAANPRISMKMLRVFSKQLRRFHQQVSKLTEAQMPDPEEGLFSGGLYYLKNKRAAQAGYMLNCYLTYYPSGKYASEAAKRLRSLGSAFKQSASPSREAQTPQAAKGPPLSGMARAYQDALALVDRQDYGRAYIAFKKIIDDDDGSEYAAKSRFETGRCFFLLERFEECIQYYTGMITKYPKHPSLGDALFYMGQSHERMDRTAQAATFYKKVLSMTAGEKNETYSNAQRALSALEG